MLFQDLSCIAENTIQKNAKAGIFAILELDWVAIVSMSYNFKISVDATLDFSGMGNEIGLSFIQSMQTELLAHRGQKYATFQYQSCHFAKLHIRETENYEVFYIYCKKNAPFLEKDLLWASLYTDKSYATVLLNNELIQNYEYLENVLDSTESTILVFDLNFNIVSYNRAARKLIGAVDRLSNISLYDLTFEDLDSLKLNIEEVIRTQRKKWMDNVVYLQQKDKNCIFSITLSPMRNSKKNIVGVVAVGTDVTKMQVMRYEFEQLSKYGLLGEIALGLSHDVKNPLMNIRGCAGLLKKKPGDSAEKDELLEIIIQEVDRINTIIEQMMSFGNVSRENDYLFLNINEVLYNCIQIVERHKIFRKLDIVTDLQESLPPFKAKNSDMQQIFLNVMLNALQAIDDDGTISITSKYSQPRQAIEVDIADNGRGIDEVDKKKLFSPYYTTKPKGTGLGLYVIKSVLEQYNGSMEIDSQVSVGTTCRILLPCHIR